MGFGYIRGKKGFTLVEILIVLVIIAILVTIAVPKFLKIATQAEQSVLKYNSTYLVKIFALNIYRYEGGNRYATIGSSEGLNNFLEDEVVGTQVDGNKIILKTQNPEVKKYYTAIARQAELLLMDVIPLYSSRVIPYMHIMAQDQRRTSKVQ